MMAKYHTFFRSLGWATAICLLSAPTLCFGEEGVTPSWRLAYKSTGYRLQTESAGGLALDHSHQYYGLSGAASGLAGGWLSLRGSGRFAGNQFHSVTPFEQSKLYTGLIEARIKPNLKAGLGRQFVQAGVTNLTLDGAVVNYRPNRRWNLTGLAGARAPAYKDFDAGDFDLARAAGAHARYRANTHWKFGLSMGYRENGGLVAERPAGAEVITSAIRHTRLFGRATYDLEQERWTRVQAQAQWRRSTSSPVIDLQFIDRHPTIDAASWFSRFTNLKRMRLARGAIRHELPNRFGGEFEYLGSYVGDRAASRIGLAVLVPGGRVGYSVRLGDIGEENRLYGEISRQVTPWLLLGADASVLNYALMSDAPQDRERDLTTMAARARLDLRPGLRVLAEVQSFENPDYDQDVRFLVGLDVSMARGSSRLGLDRGGWLQ